VRKARRRQRIRSFAPIAGRGARVLILGSMPGQRSLDAGQYYAHKQNAFWRIVGELLGIDPQAPYRARIQALKSARIAIWDVLQSCTRAGSLDSSIDRASETANDFRAFFGRHPGILHVFFNGAKAEASFRRHVAKGLESASIGTSIQYTRLPSTSPAHAGAPYSRKLAAWQAILRG
jgi:double-stranded uracil-DNA glycosylase